MVYLPFTKITNKVIVETKIATLSLLSRIPRLNLKKAMPSSCRDELLGLGIENIDKTLSLIQSIGVVIFLKRSKICEREYICF